MDLPFCPRIACGITPASCLARFVTQSQEHIADRFWLHHASGQCQTHAEFCLQRQTTNIRAASARIKSMTGDVDEACDKEYIHNGTLARQRGFLAVAASTISSRLSALKRGNGKSTVQTPNGLFICVLNLAPLFTDYTPFGGFYIPGSLVHYIILISGAPKTGPVIYGNPQRPSNR